MFAFYMYVVYMYVFYLSYNHIQDLRPHPATPPPHFGSKAKIE